MSSRRVHFAIGAAIGLAAAVALKLAPYWRSYGAYQTDGYERIGFPFTFRRVGGIAGIYEFDALALLLDIAVAGLLAVEFGWVAMKVKQRRSRGFAVVTRE